MAGKLFPCSIVGSYAQPDWLVYKERLAKRLPPRVRAADIWRIAPEFLKSAQDDATRLAIKDMEDAGLDIITDGEIRRESYSNRFATALEGIDLDNPGKAMDRTGAMHEVPRVVGPIRRKHPVEIEDARFLVANTTRTTMLSVPGPFTMSQQAQNDYYPSDGDMALAYADAVNAEIRDLHAAGIEIVMIDEPYLEARSEAAREFGVAALQRALKGVTGKTAVHICFGYGQKVQNKPNQYHFMAEMRDVPCDRISIETAQSKLDCSILRALPDHNIMLGVINLGTSEVDTVEEIVARVERALPYIDRERVILAPDCGLKYQTRANAFQKLKNMCTAAARLR
ncbi:MAG: 5-methyltetrahydropteroyltriglutamate--homocysteine methyltransferase [Gammaproteobacteria bacterium]|nr:5-methyltetrahydropteroyltriglutamate--homocysteine methyltransferase [Gammaproteobacteria bacterium]